MTLRECLAKHGGPSKHPIHRWWAERALFHAFRRMYAIDPETYLLWKSSPTKPTMTAADLLEALRRAAQQGLP